MKKMLIQKPQIFLVGITARTSFKEEQDPFMGNIAKSSQRYFQEGLGEKIPNRKNRGVTFCAYTDYESDEKGAYTYFIGEEVSSIEEPLPEGLSSLTVAAQEYAKFEAGPGPVPSVIVDAWKEIWEMSPEDLGGERSYQTDFEVYQKESMDPQNMTLDLYIGLRRRQLVK